MSMFENRHDLFQTPGASHKLDLFRSLLDAGDLSFHQAFALLTTIHSELAKPRAHASAIYIRYGEAVESLLRQMPEVHDQVVNAWDTKHGIVRFVDGRDLTSLASPDKKKLNLVNSI